MAAVTVFRSSTPTGCRSAGVCPCTGGCATCVVCRAEHRPISTYCIAMRNCCAPIRTKSNSERRLPPDLRMEAAHKKGKSKAFFVETNICSNLEHLARMRAAVASSAVGVQDTVLPYNKNFHLAFLHKNLPSLPPPSQKNGRGRRLPLPPAMSRVTAPPLTKRGFFMAKCRLGGCKADNRDDIHYKSIPIYNRVTHADWHVGNNDTLSVQYASGGKYEDPDCSIPKTIDLLYSH